MQLADELTRHGKLLYNSHEERDRMTIQSRVINFNINSPKIALGVSLPFDVMIEKIRSNHYSFVVIDSIQYMQFTYEQLQQLIETFKRKKKFGIILVSFGDVEDKPRGAIDHLHAADVKCFFKGGKVSIQNRYLDKPVHKVLFRPQVANTHPTLF